MRSEKKKRNNRVAYKEGIIIKLILNKRPKILMNKGDTIKPTSMKSIDKNHFVFFSVILYSMLHYTNKL